jgi:hypothetical protein
MFFFRPAYSTECCSMDFLLGCVCEYAEDCFTTVWFFKALKNFITTVVIYCILLMLRVLCRLIQDWPFKIQLNVIPKLILIAVNYPIQWCIFELFVQEQNLGFKQRDPLCHRIHPQKSLNIWEKRTSHR